MLIYKYEFFVNFFDDKGTSRSKRFWLERLTENDRDVIRLSEESSPESEAWLCLHEFTVGNIKAELCARMIYMSIYGKIDPPAEELSEIMDMLDMMIN